VPPVVDQVTALEHAAPDQPVDAHWLPSQLLTVEVLRRLLESTQFTSLALGSKLRQLRIRASMGSVGDCFDHALVESFFASLECELIDRRHWRTREEARLEVFWWLEAVYNRTRRHSSIGYLSPMEYEAGLNMTVTDSDPSK
jgi:transposase InsO family protein